MRENGDEAFTSAGGRWQHTEGPGTDSSCPSQARPKSAPEKPVEKVGDLLGNGLRQFHGTVERIIARIMNAKVLLDNGTRG